jgi:hypothetical protein
MEYFPKIDDILGHKASLTKYKKIEIIPCIFSDHSGIKLELDNKTNSRKYSSIWRLNNTFLHDQCGINEIGRKLKSFWNLMKMKAKPIRTCGTQQRQC